MVPIHIVREAQTRELTDDDGNSLDIDLFPSLDDAAIREFELSLPCGAGRSVRETIMTGAIDTSTKSLTTPKSEM
jgi:hypothetical protein